VENLAAAIGEERDTIEDVLEPWTLNLAEASYRLSPRDLESAFEQIVVASRALAAYHSQGNTAFRRLTVYDGDDYAGARLDLFDIA
jgi:hypothetical protein